MLVQHHWELELVTESQLKEVQMKPPYKYLRAQGIYDKEKSNE